MTNSIRGVGLQFDALIVQAESADVKVLIAAIRLQTEYLDQRLSQIEGNTAYQMNKELRVPAYGD